MNCPNCEPTATMKRIDQGGHTEVLSCPECLYVAFEYQDLHNVQDLLCALDHPTMEQV